MTMDDLNCACYVYGSAIDSHVGVGNVQVFMVRVVVELVLCVDVGVGA